MKVYLGGPIYNVSRKEATTWRAKARESLEAMGVEVIDPNRRPYIPGNEEEIIKKDLDEISESDILISFMPEDVAMAGTMMEVFFAAYTEKMPVYSFPNNSSPWVKYWSTEQFDTLEALVEFIKSEWLQPS
jgi:nucleoside 2-deoxyribosyltransferase